MRLRAAFPFLTAATLASGMAHADAGACIRASEHGQELRAAGKLRESRAELLLCQRPECPAMVKPDCAGWLRELEVSIPTIVPSAKDNHGHDVAEVRLTMDGEVLATTLDGKALAVDPGSHVFRFETRGSDPVSETVIIGEGEKNRMVRVVFGAHDATPPHPQPEPAQSEAKIPIATFILGGLGVLALGGAIYFRAKLVSDVDSLRRSCAPRCPQSDRDRLSNELVASNVSLGVGLAALGAAAVVYLTSGPKVDVVPVPSGALVRLGATF